MVATKTETLQKQKGKCLVEKGETLKSWSINCLCHRFKFLIHVYNISQVLSSFSLIVLRCLT